MPEISKRKFLTFEDFLYEEGDFLDVKTVPYAVPMDENIISVIDSPVVTEFLKYYVNARTDISHGQILAESIQVSPKSYPEVYEVAMQCRESLKMRREIDVYICPAVQGMNAMTIGTDENACIILSSMLTAVLDKNQLAFVIGHEMGHIAAGHVLYHTMLQSIRNTTTLIPIVGELIYKTVAFPLFSWYRRSEITADRAGLLCCKDIGTAQKTMIQLSSGFMDASLVDVDEYLERANNTLDKSFLRKIGELTARHPLTMKRISAMKVFVESKKYVYCTGASTDERTLISDAELEAQTEAIVRIM